MTWYGPGLSEDQRDLAAMLEHFADDHDEPLNDDPAQVRGYIRSLVDLGVWTLGVAEDKGGGGADWATAAVALVQLGRHWPALGLGSAQAHAAAELLGGSPRCSRLVDEVNHGRAAVAIVDPASTRAHLTWDGSTLSGTVDRVDTACEAPHVAVLAADHTVLVVDPAGLRSAPARRTGLAGALTRSLTIDASPENLIEVDNAQVDPGIALLRHGIAAVAAGIASAATDEAAGYAQGRHQFGDTLTAIPVVRQVLSRQAIHTSLIQAATTAGTGRDPISALAAAEQACAQAIDVAASALQSHGGYGYLSEYPAERYLRDAISLRAAADLPTAVAETARRLVGMRCPRRLTKELP